jgi:hypothetical protein
VLVFWRVGALAEIDPVAAIAVEATVATEEPGEPQQVRVESWPVPILPRRPPTDRALPWVSGGFEA